MGVQLNTIHDDSMVINSGSPYMSKDVVAIPEHCNIMLGKAIDLFKSGKFEYALEMYLNVAKTDGSASDKIKYRSHDMYDMQRLNQIVGTYLNNFGLVCLSSALEKGFLTMGISQCLNNIIAKYFNCNDYTSITECGKLQRLVLVCMLAGVEVLNKEQLQVDFKCNNIVNFNYALYELNCGIINQSAPGKQNEAEKFLRNALMRMQMLAKLDPSVRHIKMQSVISEQLGNSEEALRYAEEALSQTGKISLDNISQFKYVAAMEAADKKMLIRLY